MPNSSILSLSIKYSLDGIWPAASIPPLLTQSRLFIKNLYSSSSFSPLILSSAEDLCLRVSESYVLSSLSSPIYLTQLNYTGPSRHLSIVSDGSVFLSQCSFVLCNSSTITSQRSTISIADCVFSACHSSALSLQKGGGAALCESSAFSVIRSCFCSCFSAFGKGNSLYIVSSDIANISMSSFVSCSDESLCAGLDALSVTGGYQYLSNLNFSKCFSMILTGLSSGPSFSNGWGYQLFSSTIMNSSGRSIVSSVTNVGGSTLNCNFVSNLGFNCIFSLTNSLSNLVSGCYFVRNCGNLVTKINSTATFLFCFSDNQFPLKNADGLKEVRGITTLALVHLNTAECFAPDLEREILIKVIFVILKVFQFSVITILLIFEMLDSPSNAEQSQSGSSEEEHDI